VPTAAPRVLVADDEDDIRALVGLAVRRAGCTVTTEVPDGTQALAAARTDPPDLAVLDVSMPGATSRCCCCRPAPPPTTSPAAWPPAPTPTWPSPSPWPGWSPGCAS
jgi:CheY-like chemotaxis protein